MKTPPARDAIMPAVRAALSQHRWRNAQNPAGMLSRHLPMSHRIEVGVQVPELARGTER